MIDAMVASSEGVGRHERTLTIRHAARGDRWSNWAIRMSIVTLALAAAAGVRAETFPWTCINGGVGSGDTTKSIKDNELTCRGGKSLYQCKMWPPVAGQGVGYLANRADHCSWGPDPWKTFFAPACDAHDMCYHVPGNSRKFCDDLFDSRMRFMCETLADRASCVGAAGSFAEAVRLAAQGAWANDQGWAEDTCCGGNQTCLSLIAQNRLCTDTTNDKTGYEIGRSCYNSAGQMGTCQVVGLTGKCVVKLDNGKSCVDNDECKSGHCNGFCRECTADSQCGSGKICDNTRYVCKALLANGQSCLRDSECASTHCNGICRECTADSQCGSGKICDNTRYVCKALLANGQSCLRDSECVSTHCNGFCRSCTADSHCGTGKICDNTGFYCKALLANGQSCLRDSECVSTHCNGICRGCTADSHCGSGKICDNSGFYCKDKLDDGKICSLDRECKSGRCAWGFCSKPN